MVYAAGQRLSCHAIDISAGGVCVLPPARGDPGLLLRLNIGFSSGHTVAVDGVVVREGKVGSRYAWGVRFHRVPLPIQKQLVEQVAGEERRSAGAHIPTRRLSTGRGHPKVKRESSRAQRSSSHELVEADDAPSVGEYKQIGRRGSRERIRLPHRQRGHGSDPQQTADPRASQSSERPPTGPAHPQIAQRQRSQSRWEIDLMGAGDEAPEADPDARPMRPLVAVGREPPTGPAYPAVGWRGAASERDPELEQAIGDELESLLRAAMEKLDDEER